MQQAPGFGGGGAEAAGAKVHTGSPGGGGTGFRRPALASSATKASEGPCQQARPSQPRRPSLQGSIFQVLIFLPVYW